MATSTVPAVLDAILALLRASPDLSGVQVVDGQPLRTDPDVVCIGFTGNAGESSVESTRTVEQLKRQPDREQYEITSLASSWSGATDPVAVRNRAYELLDVVAAELAKDPRLGGLVTEVRLSSDRFAQEQTSKGAVATVMFTITVNAFTRR